jgi:hypothetical protein
MAVAGENVQPRICVAEPPRVGNPMNLSMVISVYASISRELGLPLRFPGTSNAYTALYQVTSADILARATEWATTSPSAANEIFNVTAGVDVYLGQTRFTKPKAVAVEGRELRFNKAVIATGSHTVAPMRYDLERGGWSRRGRFGRAEITPGLLRSKAFFSGFEVSRA